MRISYQRSERINERGQQRSGDVVGHFWILKRVPDPSGLPFPDLARPSGTITAKSYQGGSILKHGPPSLSPLLYPHFAAGRWSMMDIATIEERFGASLLALHRRAKTVG